MCPWWEMLRGRHINHPRVSGPHVIPSCWWILMEEFVNCSKPMKKGLLCTNFKMSWVTPAIFPHVITSRCPDVRWIDLADRLHPTAAGFSECSRILEPYRLPRAFTHAHTTYPHFSATIRKTSAACQCFARRTKNWVVGQQGVPQQKTLLFDKDLMGLNGCSWDFPWISQQSMGISWRFFTAAWGRNGNIETRWFTKRPGSVLYLFIVEPNIKGHLFFEDVGKNKDFNHQRLKKQPPSGAAAFL